MAVSTQELKRELAEPLKAAPTTSVLPLAAPPKVVLHSIDDEVNDDQIRALNPEAAEDDEPEAAEDDEPEAAEDDEPEVGEWEPCVLDVGYDVFTLFPHQVRRRRGTRIVAESLDTTTGYVRLALNRRMYYKHRVVALQFIQNPDPAELTEVDHINRNRTDNRTDNLRWVSSRMNARNKTSQKGVVCMYIDDLPDDVIPINRYNGHFFDGYFYSRKMDVCYFDNGLQYRVLVYSTTLGGGRSIKVRGIDHIVRTVYLNKWIRDEL